MLSASLAVLTRKSDGMIMISPLAPIAADILFSRFLTREKMEAESGKMIHR